MGSGSVGRDGVVAKEQDLGFGPFTCRESSDRMYVGLTSTPRNAAEALQGDYVNSEPIQAAIGS